MPSQVLIICGPTATGKTKFAIEVATKFDGEIISADSRQVFTGKNIIHGKDLPPNAKCQMSNVKWRDRFLKYYLVDTVKIWLYDIVNPGEDFSVAYWRECAELAIEDILSRKKLPIVVGGSGLYLKSLTQNLDQMSVPPNQFLRSKLQNKSPKYLCNYLSKIDSFRAARMNLSDRQNSRRLVRAIEISVSQKGSPFRLERAELNVLQIGLTTSRDYLYELVNRRVSGRVDAGAGAEDSDLAGNLAKWQGMEHGIVRHQLTWFKKQRNIYWFDTGEAGWREKMKKLVSRWYNLEDDTKD